MKYAEKSKVQFITHFTDSIDYVQSAQLALEGGCKWIQLRMKDAKDAEILPVAKQIRQLCTEHNAVFLIDDHVDLVEQIGADGVHLGKKDMPIEQARAILGPDKIIGGTANTFEDVLQHAKAGASYIGCGPFRFTTTKKGLSPILGLEGYQHIVKQMREHHIDLPIVAIGGIEYDDIPAIMQTGVTGIALSGTVLRAQDPAAEMQRILKQVQANAK